MRLSILDAYGIYHSLTVCNTFVDIHEITSVPFDLSKFNIILFALLIL